MKLCLSCGISCMEEIMGKQEPRRVAILFGAQIAAKRKEKGITQGNYSASQIRANI